MALFLCCGMLSKIVLKYYEMNESNRVYPVKYELKSD